MDRVCKFLNAEFKGMVHDIFKYKYYSVTEMLLALGLPSFDTVIHNYRNSFLCVWSKHSNDMVKLLRCVCPSAFL